MKAVTNRTIVLAVKNVAYSLITAHIIKELLTQEVFSSLNTLLMTVGHRIL